MLCQAFLSSGQINATRVLHVWGGGVDGGGAQQLGLLFRGQASFCAPRAFDSM